MASDIKGVNWFRLAVVWYDSSGGHIPINSEKI